MVGTFWKLHTNLYKDLHGTLKRKIEEPLRAPNTPPLLVWEAALLK